MQQLLQAGESDKVCENVLWEIGDLDFTTRDTEQGHIFLAQTRRYRPGIEEEQLTARAGLQTARAVLTPTATAQKVERLERQLENPQRGGPKNLQGRHLFLSEALRIAPQKNAQSLKRRCLERASLRLVVLVGVI